MPVGAATGCRRHGVLKQQGPPVRSAAAGSQGTPRFHSLESALLAFAEIPLHDARVSDAVLIAGIDEAGYGPILGPLVVTATVFEVPIRFADASLWDLLSKSVTDEPVARDGRVAILDSKKLYKPKEGLARLERSVLAAVCARHGLPARLSRLLGLVCPDILSKLAEYPWYRGVDPALPLRADSGSIRIAAGQLKRDLAARSIRLAGVWSEVLPEGHYNRLVGGTRNKAVVLLGLTLRLIQRIGDAHRGGVIRFFVDKQGARDRYGAVLMRSFSQGRLRVIHEDNERSEYELIGPRSEWRISFHESGEARHLPVALASCVSKYVRELFMSCFNEFWSGHVPGLAGTAGYYQDGLRFLKDIAPRMEEMGIDQARLVRAR